MRSSAGVDVVIITRLKAAATKKRFYVIAGNILRAPNHYEFAAQIRDSLDGFLGEYFVARRPHFNSQECQWRALIDRAQRIAGATDGNIERSGHGLLNDIGARGNRRVRNLDAELAIKTFVVAI